MTQTDPIPMTNPNQGGVVGYKAWLPLAGGGSETIEIVLPLGAAPEALEQAIAQWRRMRAEGQQALKAAQGPPPEPHDIVISFGKYSGHTLGAILAIDPEYVGWLADKARDPAI